MVAGDHQPRPPTAAMAVAGHHITAQWTSGVPHRNGFRGPVLTHSPPPTGIGPRTPNDSGDP